MENKRADTPFRVSAVSYSDDNPDNAEWESIGDIVIATDIKWVDNRHKARKQKDPAEG